MDTRSVATIKLDALIRLLMSNLLSGVVPLYLITEYQKSGGTWVGQMLAEYLDVPFPRNRIPAIQTAVLHGHLMPTRFLKNVLCVFRDGRDAVVSSYYHMLFESDKNAPILVKRTRDALKFHDYEDIRNNLPIFTEYLFTVHHTRTLFRPNQFTWSEFVDAWLGRDVVKVKYEDLIRDAIPIMAQAIAHLTGDTVDILRLTEVVEKYSFESQAKRKPGQEDTKSFLRKGQPGDWKEKFKRETAEIFHYYAGSQLIAMGYEKDSGWVDTVDE